jgi:hypothetical protein
MFNPYRKLAKLSLNRDRLSCISCRCMKLASRSAMESASSANAGSRASMANLPPLIGLTYPAPPVPSRKDDLELGRKGVVGREEGPLWREAERCALPASMALSSPGNVFAAEMAGDENAWSKAWITASAGECTSVHVELLMVDVPNAQGPRGVADGARRVATSDADDGRQLARTRDQLSARMPCSQKAYTPASTLYQSPPPQKPESSRSPRISNSVGHTSTPRPTLKPGVTLPYVTVSAD